MESGEFTKFATTLLAERSRDALLAQLTTAPLAQPDLLGLVTDLLLVVGQDNDSLKLRVAHLLASRFGRSSERSSAAQLVLFGELLNLVQTEQVLPDDTTESKANVPPLSEQTEQQIDALVEQKRQEQKEAKERRRQAEIEARAEGKPSVAVPWPTHLPVREETIDVDAADRACSDCEQERGIIGQETSWRIEATTKCEVVVTHRLTRACQAHHGGPVTPPAPPKPVDKGHLGFGLAAHAISLRFAHNLPIHRIVEMFADHGIPVSEEVLHTLFTTTSERVEPVLETLAVQVRASDLVNIDDTPVLVLDPEEPKRRRRARIWLALGDGHWAWFFSTKTWKEEDAEARLGKLTGTLQGDGYKGFKKLAKKNGIAQAGCMAHLRRKLRKAMLAHDPRATEAVALVHGLYRVEKLAKLQELDADGVLALRKERSVPLMDALERWAREVASTIETGSPLGQAWTYLDNQWSYLRQFLLDGRVSIDNNAAERGLRRITIGRKLWLFFRGDETVERAARLASILTTARLHGANELAYLTWLLQELARREWSVEAARQLLPDVWLAAQKKQAEEGRAVES